MQSWAFIKLDWKLCDTAANANKATFKITNAKLYVPIVTFSTEDNAKLSKLLMDQFIGTNVR